MTVSTTAGYSGPYVPNGSTTAFPFTFNAGSAAEVQVELDGVVVGSGYTVTLNTDQAASPGGTVTFAIAPVGLSLAILSDPDFTQEISFTNSGPFLASSHDEVADQSARKDIALRRDTDRAVKVPIGETAPDFDTLKAELKGDPGGGAGDIGLFVGASGLEIPVGIDLVQTVGYSTVDIGAAVYVYDAAVNAAYVTAHPRSSFRTTNARGFRLSYEQDLTPQMLGAPANGVSDDSPAIQAAIDALPALGGTILIPAGSYKLDTTPNVGSKTIAWDMDAATTITGAGTAGGTFPTINLKTNTITAAAVLGTLPAGSKNVNNFSATASGDGSGSTQLYYNVSRVYGVTGPFDYVREGYRGTHIQTTGGVNNADGLHQYVWGEANSHIVNGAVIAAHFRLDAGGVLTNEIQLFRAVSTVVGSGAAIQRIVGFSVGDIGHATQVQDVIGLDIPNLLGANSVIGIKANIAAAANKWFIYSSGAAQSVISGFVRFGSVVAPTEAVDVTGNIKGSGEITSSGGRVGYTTGAGGQISQATSRTTAVTINKVVGDITLVSAAGSATYQKVTVNNSLVASNDTVRLCQKSGTDLYETHVVRVANGAFDFIFRTTGGTTTETPVFNFAIIKGTNN